MCSAAMLQVWRNRRIIRIILIRNDVETNGPDYRSYVECKLWSLKQILYSIQSASRWVCGWSFWVQELPTWQSLWVTRTQEYTQVAVHGLSLSPVPKMYSDNPHTLTYQEPRTHECTLSELKTHSNCYHHHPYQRVYSGDCTGSVIIARTQENT